MPIYFGRIGDHIPVKIGHAHDPAGRLITLQTANFEPVWFSRLLDGTEVDEIALHQRFRALRIRGEWFAWHPDMTGDLGLPDLAIPRATPVDDVSVKRMRPRRISLCLRGTSGKQQLTESFPHIESRVRELHAQGLSRRQIADEMNITGSDLSVALEAFGLLVKNKSREYLAPPSP